MQIYFKISDNKQNKTGCILCTLFFFYKLVINLLALSFFRTICIDFTSIEISNHFSNSRRVIFALPKEYTDISDSAFLYQAVCKLRGEAGEDTSVAADYELYYEDNNTCESDVWWRIEDQWDSRYYVYIDLLVLEVQ